MNEFDRKILRELVQDSGQTYSEMGRAVGLSAPAVFDRVKKMKAAGTITGTTAQLDGAKVGKPLLAFVHVNSDGWGKGPNMMMLRNFPEVEEIHSVAGDACVIIKVRTQDAQALENLLHIIYKIPGVHGTRSYIALSTYLERSIQADITTHWPTDDDIGGSERENQS